MGAKRGFKNGAKSPLEDFGLHLGRPRCRKRRFKNGSKIGPEKRRLLDQVPGLSGVGPAECAGALELVLGRFKQDLARNFTRSAPTGAADSIASRIPPGQGRGDSNKT